MTMRWRGILVALAIEAALVAAALAADVGFEWTPPTKLSDGSTIPAALLSDLRVTIWRAPVGTTNWVAAGTTTTATNRITVAIPVGAWNIAATAQFLDEAATRGDLSLVVGKRVYWRVTTVGGLKVLTIP